MKGLLKKIGGALTLGSAMIVQTPEAEAHHPGYWSRPAPTIVTHQTIGPFGGVWTHREIIRSAPVYIRPTPVFVQQQIYIQPAPVLIQPAPILVQPPIYVAPPVYIYPHRIN